MQASTQSSTPFPSSLCSPRPHPGGVTAPVPSSGKPLSEPAALAHDAANILGALVLYCDLLQQPGVLGPQHSHYGRELTELARRSSSLIERLLDQLYQRAGSTPDGEAAGPLIELLPLPVAEPGERYDPCDKLRELEPLLSSLSFPHAVLALDLPAHLDAWTVPSAEALERIVVNLVCNAAQALAGWERPRSADRGHPAPRGRITVSLRRIGRCTCLEVADDGPGIDAGMAAGFLLPPDPVRMSERGMGHRIVQQLAAASGARLSVDSQPGRGASFVLSWLSPDGAPSALGRSAAADFCRREGGPRW